MKNVKPFDRYYGGKEADGVYQNIINKIPPHDIFVSGCLGNCAVMRHKKPAPVMNIGIDLDPDVIAAWEEFPHFSYFFYCQDIVDYLRQEIPNLLLKAKRVFIYLDPPYLASIQKSKRAVYKCEMLSDQEHTRLLECVTGISETFPQRVFFMVSSYPNDLYDSLLSGWHTFSFKYRIRKGTATEVLYMNYSTPIELHDYRYLGKDYRDRHRIKSRINRNVERLVRMDPLERNAIIQAMKEANELTTIK